MEPGGRLYRLGRQIEVGHSATLDFRLTKYRKIAFVPMSICRSSPAAKRGFSMRSYHSALALSVLLSAMACTQDQSPTGPEATPAPELSATAAATLVFRAISAGDSHTCGVTTTNKAYCWGSEFGGALGDGGDFNSNVPVAV